MVRNLISLLLLTPTLFLLIDSTASTKSLPSESVVPLRQVIKQPGAYKSIAEGCQILLEISEMGGYLKLTVNPPSLHIFKDITGIAWASDDILLFTVSPIYGEPGVFLFNCVTKQISRIIAPKTVNKGYPSGADYFELQGFSKNDEQKFYFFYAPDVDAVDFSRFRTKDFLFQSRLDGTGWEKFRE